MKSILFLLTPCLATAFAPAPVHQKNVAPLSASRNNHETAASSAAAAVFVALLSTSSIANAAPLNQHDAVASSYSSSTLLSSTTVDQFTLPSYESAKGVTVIDLKDEVQDVNKKTMATAKAKREFQDNSAEKTEMDRLRQIEAEESKLFDSMTKQSDKDRKARIEAEIAESRANRWNTF